MEGSQQQLDTQRVWTREPFTGEIPCIENDGGSGNLSLVQGLFGKHFPQETQQVRNAFLVGHGNAQRGASALAVFFHQAVH